MKRFSLILAFVAFVAADMAHAASAVVTALTGIVQVQTGNSAAKSLRQGDEVMQGDTVSTGPSSTVVLKFDDGQVAALTANSRLVITSYVYEPSTSSGTVLLSLITGGMRAITGLIGKKTPAQVSYRAATATIGIRGTDVIIATSGGDVLVSVTEGQVALTIGAQSLTITANQAVLVKADGTVIRGTLAEVSRQATGPIASALSQFEALNGPINAASPGTPRRNDGSGSGDSPAGTTGGQQGQAGIQGSGPGGGRASP